MQSVKKWAEKNDLDFRIDEIGMDDWKWNFEDGYLEGMHIDRAVITCYDWDDFDIAYKKYSKSKKFHIEKDFIISQRHRELVIYLTRKNEWEELQKRKEMKENDIEKYWIKEREKKMTA